MRSVNLLKIAAEAEILRYRCMLVRQGRRAAFGASALLFGIIVLVLGEIAGWQALHLRFAPIATTYHGDQNQDGQNIHCPPRCPGNSGFSSS